MFNPLENLKKYDVILASGSPRRKELLAMLDIDFRVDTSYGVDEIIPPGLALDSVPAYLSELKASAYPVADNQLVITADTVVLLGDTLLGKPADKEDACAMLASLADRTQRVITGVTIRTASQSETWSVESSVTFGPLTADEIAYYVDRYSPLDKAGAYGIQEWIGAAAIKNIDGSFYNVMGLPVHTLFTRLKKY